MRLFDFQWDFHKSLRLAFTLSLLVIFYFLQDAHAQRRYRWSGSRRGSSKAPGPNMCKVLEVLGTKQRYFTHCIAKHMKVICERPTYERWECCPGFRKKGRDRGCSEEKPLGNLLDTTSELKLEQFNRLVKKTSKLRSELRQYGPYTVFAPSDDAIAEAPTDVRKRLSSLDDSLRMYHLAPGRLNISTFHRKNQQFVTLLNQEKIRVNKYGYGVSTVNCARIIRADLLATNGIIHVIDKVITPEDMNETLMGRVSSNGHFSQFKMALFVSGMVKTLNRKRASFTLLAPTNTAFSKLPTDLMDRILTDADTAEKVIKRHVVKGIHCSDAIVVSIGLKTLDDTRLLFRCKKNGLRVNEAKVTDKDIVASNGVLHGIDTVLLPDSVKKASELMYDMRMDTFLDMAANAGLNDTLDGDNITMFLPSDKAVRKLSPPFLAALRAEPLKMQKYILYHIISGKLTEDLLVGESSLKTKSPMTTRIKVNIYRKGILIDKASLKSYPRQCRNAVIHKLDDPLVPPEETFEDVIYADPELSVFAELYKSSGLNLALYEADRYTLIIPTNRAFERLDPRSWKSLVSDPARIRKFLNRHIINRMVLKCSIPERGVYGIKSVQGDETEFTIDTIKRVIVNKHARTVSEDILTSNGVIYKVDHVLPCSCERRMRSRRGQYLYSYRYRRV